MLVLPKLYAAAVMIVSLLHPHPDVSRETVDWAQMRACESSSTYDIDTGNSFYGAYQFLPSTWDYTLGWMAEDGYEAPYDWNQWVGVLPSRAPSEVQDHVARYLAENDRDGKGLGHWPQCSGSGAHRLAEPTGGLPPLVDAPVPTFAG